VPRIQLTFDDGPDPRWTPAVLDALAAHGLRATFFVVGRSAQAHAALLRRVTEAGHALGNHTWSHRHPWTLARADAVREVVQAAQAIADAAGAPPRLFRPPFGRRRPCMSAAAAEMGARTVMWSRSAVDWGPLANPAGIARRLARVRDGETILLHDAARGSNRPECMLAVLPQFLARLQGEGWTAGFP